MLALKCMYECRYRVECKECPPGWQRSPGSRVLNTTKVIIHGLAPKSLVTVFIYAENEVSQFVPGIPMYAVVEVRPTLTPRTCISNSHLLGNLRT